MVGVYGSSGAAASSGSDENSEQYLDDFLGDVSKIANGQEVSSSDLDATLKNLTAHLSDFHDLPPKFKDDLIDYQQHGSSGTNMIAEMMNELKSGSGVPSYKASGLSMAVEAQFQGDDSNITAQLLRNLSNVTSGKKVAGPAQLEKLFYALGALNPSGLSKSFQTDLQEFFQNGTSGTGAISQLLNSLKSNTVPSPEDGGIAMAIQAQYTGDTSVITAPMLNDLAALSKNPKALSSSQIAKLEQMFYALGELNPAGLPKNFQTDLADFMKNGTAGKGMIAGLMKALKTGDTKDVSSYATVVTGEYQGQSSSISQLLLDLQKLGENPNSVPVSTMQKLLKEVTQTDISQLPPGLQEDLQDYAKNGTKGTGNIAKMMNAMETGKGSDISAYAIIVNMEAGGSTDITSAIQKDLSNLQSDPTSVSVSQLTSLLKAASILQIKGFQPAFAADISDFEKNGTAGKGFISQLVKSMQSGNNTQTQALAGAASIEQQTGKTPLEALTADLQSLSTNPSSVTYANFTMALNAVAALDPAGMSPELQKDLQDYKNQDPHSLFSQLSSALKSKQTANVMPLAMALNYESKGGSQALLSQIEKDLSSIQNNPKSVSVTAFTTEMKALAYLNPSSLSQSFNSDLQDFNAHGAKGTGVIAQMVAAMQSGNNADVPYMAAAITAQDKGDSALLKEVSSLLSGVETHPEAANAQQLTQALKTLAYLNPSNESTVFKSDLQDFLKNGTSGTGNIAKMMKALNINYGEASNIAKEVQQEMENSPAQLMASLQSDFQSLAKDPSSVSPEDLANLLKLITSGDISGYPPGMQQELQNYSKGTGLLANLLSQMKETPKPSIITTTAMVLNDVSLGKVSDIEGAFQSDLKKIEGSPGSVSFTEMDELVRGLAESDPTGLPAGFQAGLQDYVKNGTSGSSLVAQFMKSVQNPSKSGDGALQCKALAQAVSMQLSGQDSSLVNQLKTDISQLISSGKGPSADDLKTLLYTIGNLKMGPPQIPSGLQTDINDFMQNGTSGSGYLSQLVSGISSGESTQNIEYTAMGVQVEVDNTSFANILNSDLASIVKDPESMTFDEMDKLFRAINYLNPESINNLPIIEPNSAGIAKGQTPITFKSYITSYIKYGPDVGAGGSYVQNLMGCLKGETNPKNKDNPLDKYSGTVCYTLEIEVMMKGGDTTDFKNQFSNLLTQLKNNPGSINTNSNEYCGFVYAIEDINHMNDHLHPPISNDLDVDATNFVDNMMFSWNHDPKPVGAFESFFKSLLSGKPDTNSLNQIIKMLGE